MQVPRIVVVTSRVCNFAALEVTSNARRPPSILQVNKEAREEAKKVYTLRIFDTSGPASLSRIIYFNPESEIVYFSEIPNTATMIKFLHEHISSQFPASYSISICTGEDTDPYH